jgi:predicted phosphoribosyltransferase
MELSMFVNREDAAKQLASQLRGRAMQNPIVLAIPRGGVAIGAVLARELGAELDVVLARKLRCPGQPELALGAISEDGQVYLNPEVQPYAGQDYLAQEKKYQLTEIARRSRVFRGVRPAASLAGRTVIVTDDGIATGATMIAALQAVRGAKAHEIIVAVPVASPDRLAHVRRLCDETVCLLAPEDFWAIGQFYRDFRQVEDAEVRTLLRDFVPAKVPAASHRARDQAGRAS